ncbi:MAG: hypothetical protein QXP45_02995 [Thermoproteota archaeon]
MMEPIIKGRESLGRGNIVGDIWSLLGKRFFIDKLASGIYSREKELLDDLEKWAIDFNRKSRTIYDSGVSVDIGVFSTHQDYVRGFEGRREFGDITFVTIFSSPTSKVAYANTFQIKVSDFAEKAYRELFRHHVRQLDFYRRDFVKTLGKPEPLLCDFLYYWLIGTEIPHPIKEVPLSLTWLHSDQVFNWPRYYLRPMDTLFRCLFLVTGIDVDFLLKRRLCTPGLEKILRIIKEGVRKFISNSIKRSSDIEDVRLRTALEKLGDSGSLDPYPEKPPEEGFERPEFPISSRIVIATEVSFKE